MAIKNIIFDMGGVLADFDPARSLANHFTKEDIPLVDRYTYKSQYWQDMDEGIYDTQEALGYMCSHLPERLRGEVRKMVLDREGEMPPIEEMYPVVKALKEQNYKIYLLSNCPEWFYSFKKSIPAFQFFDGFIISATYRQIKPHEDIYLTLLREFSLEASECFFIDDSPANVETAVKLGFSAYCFNDRNTEKLKAALNREGVKI